jgi:hypothetical protein
MALITTAGTTTKPNGMTGDKTLVPLGKIQIISCGDQKSVTIICCTGMMQILIVQPVK